MNRKLALLSLGAGTVLFALAPPILKLLTTMGGRLGFRMPGAISLCNVLFVGNFCAGMVSLAYGGPRRIRKELAGLGARTWSLLLAAAAVSAIYPALLFTGLERTSVINVVLLSRFNGIVFVVLAAIFLGTMVRRREAAGYAVMAAGVATLLVMSNHGLRISSGEIFVLASTVFFALTEILSRFVLRGCSLRTYVFFRNLASSIIFFVTGLFLFGAEHFSEAFTGELWALMVIYATLAVVAAQMLWIGGARALPPQTAAGFQLLNPAFTLLFAFLLLSEVPSATELLAMGVILVGMLIPRIPGRWRTRPGVAGPAEPRQEAPSTPMSLSPEMGLAGR